MARYTVSGRVAHFGPGIILALTEQQLALRAHLVEAAAGGHTPLEVIQFKRGELIDIVAGDIGKAQLEVLTEGDVGAAELAAAPPVSRSRGRRAARPAEAQG